LHTYLVNYLLTYFIDRFTLLGYFMMSKRPGPTFWKLLRKIVGRFLILDVPDIVFDNIWENTNQT